MFLKWLETFCKLAENRSFSNTADELCLTQPSISNQISQLEKELGITLVNRTTKKVDLTKAGEVVYFHAIKVLKEVNSLKDFVNEFKGLNVGEIVVGASTLPGEYILPKIFYQYNLKYPSVGLNVLINDTFKIINNVREGLVELGIVGSLANNTNDLDFYEFIEDEIIFIGNSEISISDINMLRKIPIITREKGSGTIFTVKECLVSMDFDYESIKFIARVGSLNAVKEMVKSGLGYSFVSAFAVKDELKAGIVKKIDIKGVTPIKRKFYIVTSKYFKLSPSAEKLKDFLLNFSKKIS